VILAFFPSIAIFLSGLLGIASPVNFVFLVIIFILMVKCFSLSIYLSQLNDKIKKLSQHIAINEKVKEDREKQEVV